MAGGQRIPTIEEIDALLPQTQCEKCKHPGCRPYAEAISQGEDINHCVPGGPEVIAALSVLTGRPAKPLDPAYGRTLDQRLVAFIREEECIGCTKCLKACPVDAIVGAAKLMHTVIIADCTGCDLCVAPCPVDCIDMLPTSLPRLPLAEESSRWRVRHDARSARLANEEEERKLAREKKAAESARVEVNVKALTVAAALARSNLKKHERKMETARQQGDDIAALEEEGQRLKLRVEEVEAQLRGAR